MNAAEHALFQPKAPPIQRHTWVGGLPLAGLPALALGFGFRLAPWVFMWALSFAIFFGCKWLTWWQNKDMQTTSVRRLGYLFAWPGMDAEAFLNRGNKAHRPGWVDWIAGTLKICFGATLLWGCVRLVPVSEPLVRGWIGLIGLIFLLHFGTFHLLALGWQSFGIDAQPLMRAPITATSLSEFWGARWNSAFNQLVHDWLFRPFFRTVGTVQATMLVFLVSGLIHELVISVPARGGYGGPTIYFLMQGAGVIFERSPVGKRIDLRRGVAGWLFTLAVAAGPVFWLFHPAFITRVILPFLRVLNAT